MERIRCVIVVGATRDAGRSWRPVGKPIRVPGKNEGRFFIKTTDAARAWIYGSASYVTEDGGKTWRGIRAPGSIESITVWGNRAWGIATRCGASRCSATLVTARTEDHRWQAVATQPPGQFVATGLVALGSSVLLVVEGADEGEGAIRVTFDGGRSWRTRRTPCRAMNVAALDVSHIWLACGQEPSTGDQVTTIYRSSDGGSHWQLMADNPHDFEHRRTVGNVPRQGHIGDLVITPNRRVLLSRGKFGSVWFSDDGGRVWKMTLSDDGAGGYSLQFVDAQHGWASSVSTLYKTVDGGEHWRLVAKRRGY